MEVVADTTVLIDLWRYRKTPKHLDDLTKKVDQAAILVPFLRPRPLVGWLDFAMEETRNAAETPPADQILRAEKKTVFARRKSPGRTGVARETRARAGIIRRTPRTNFLLTRRAASLYCEFRDKRVPQSRDVLLLAQG